MFSASVFRPLSPNLLPMIGVRGLVTRGPGCSDLARVTPPLFVRVLCYVVFALGAARAGWRGSVGGLAGLVQLWRSILDLGSLHFGPWLGDRPPRWGIRF